MKYGFKINRAVTAGDVAKLCHQREQLYQAIEVLENIADMYAVNGQTLDDAQNAANEFLQQYYQEVSDGS